MTSLRSLTSNDAHRFVEDTFTNESGRWYFNYSDRLPDVVTATVALDSTPAAIVLTDLSGQVVHVNRAMQDFLRADSLASLIGKHIGELCELLPVELVEELACDGKSRDIVVAERDVEEKKILCSARRIDGEGHTPRWLVFSFFELNAEIASDARGSSGETDWADAEKSSGIGHWRIVVGASEEIEAASVTLSPGMRALLRIDGTDRAIPLRHWLALVVPEDRERFLDRLRRLRSGAQSFECEYRLTGAGKYPRTMRSRAKLGGAPAIDGAESSAVLIGTELDVTRSDTEREHRNAMDALTSIIESSECPTYAVDRRLRLICANRAFRETFELHEGAIEGRELRALFPETPLRRSVLRNIRRALSGERRIEAIELLRAASGVRRWLDMSYNPIASESGEIIGAVVFTAEISANKYASTAELRHG